MKLQTQIPLTSERNQIDYDSKVLLLGSCFVENIGEKLDYFKFDASCNPFGIVFHPVAIEKLVTRAINEEEFTAEDIFYYNEQWHCFEVHSQLSALNKDVFLKKLNDALARLKSDLFSATHIVFTYGTSWVYRHIETDEIASNCHKIPQKKFLKELLTVEEVSEAIDNTITLVKDFNPDVNFVITVSPVRHIKDGFVENSRSKAHLLAGLHALVAPRNRIHYFPSFEIVLDELRDYRFYAEDMLHPNTTAINIIWEKFNQVWISSETKNLQREIEVIQNGLSHRPFNQESEAHQAFLKDLQLKIKALQQKLPQLKF